MNLHGLRVLVTRPRPEGEDLCEKIHAANGQAIYLPTIEIQPLPGSSYQPEISQLAQYDWLIFVSPRAAIYFAHALRAMELSLPDKIQIAAIGANTADALRRQHFSVSLIPQQDWRTEGLLELPELQHIIGKHIAIIAGEGGRELLADTLIERGAKVTRIAVYRRVLPEMNVAEYIHFFRSHLIDIIVSTSIESVQNLVKLIGDDNLEYLQSVTLLVVSERIAIYARDQGFKKVILAKDANHASILDVLRQQRKG